MRRALGWTQARIAEELGVNALTVSKWERGSQAISEPAARLLLRIAAEEKAKKRAK